MDLINEAFELGLGYGTDSEEDGSRSSGGSDDEDKDGRGGNTSEDELRVKKLKIKINYLFNKLFKYFFLLIFFEDWTWKETEKLGNSEAGSTGRPPRYTDTDTAHSP